MGALVAGLVALLLLLDPFVLDRGAHEMSMRDAGLSTAGFLSAGVPFGVTLGTAFSVTAACQHRPWLGQGHGGGERRC